MTIEDATQTLKKHAHQELTKAASDFLADLLSEEFNMEDDQVLSALLNNGWIQDSIDYLARAGRSKFHWWLRQH